MFLINPHFSRHLSSELAEMLGVIDTLMKEEFEKYSTADLNRPLLDFQTDILEGVCWQIYFRNYVLFVSK